MRGPKQGRLPFLDWMRGIAALIMLQGHTFHSFASAETRKDGPYNLSQFFGGIGPAIFLFLTGITFSFILERGERKNLSMWNRWVQALYRARYLFVLAFLFRLQLWSFAFGQSPWTDLLKVDVLNCMGLTMFVLSPLALLPLAQRMRWSAIAAVVIAALGPWVSAVDWQWLPPQVSNYFVPNLNFFSFFPWAAYLAFGVAAGSLLKMARAEDMNRLMQWSAIAGFVMLIAARYFSDLPYSIYNSSDFWLNSPAMVFCKLGILLMFSAFAYLWYTYVVGDKWSWVAQIGTTSLLVYWVHIEIVYGRWFGFWKDQFNNVQCVIYSVVLIAVMLGMSVVRTRLKGVRLPEWAPDFGGALSPRRVSGD